VRGTLLGALLAAAAGVVGCLLWGRGEAALGFAIGAGVSALNFRLIAAAVGQLDPRSPGWRGVWKGALARFALAGGVLVLALAVFRLSLLPLAAGLLVTQCWMIGQWLWYSLKTL
jgi:hypothetical protein